MKNIFKVIFTIVIASLMLISCSENKNVQFNEFYSEVIGFSDTDEKSKSVPKDAILMKNNEDFQSFQDEYFTPREVENTSTSLVDGIYSTWKWVMFIEVDKKYLKDNMKIVVKK